MRRPSTLLLSALVTVTAALVAASCVPPPSEGGYATRAAVPRDTYTVRIHPSIAHLTGDILWAAGEASLRSGVRLVPGPPATSTSPNMDTGEIVVAVGSDCGPSAVGCAVTSWDADAMVLTGSLVTVAPSWARPREGLRQLLLHEFGHALGLNHFDGNFAGTGNQVMHSVVQPQMPTYGFGDTNGLRNHGAAGRARLAERSPRGTLEAVTPVEGQAAVAVVGWAADDDLARSPIRVSVLIDGVLSVPQQTAGTWRDDVALAHPRLGGGHGFSLTAPAPPGTRRVCVVAHNFRWGADREIGCRSVTVPIPPDPPSTPTPSAPRPGGLGSLAAPAPPPPPLRLETEVHAVYATAGCGATALGPVATPTPASRPVGSSPSSHSHACGCGCTPDRRRSVLDVLLRRG